MKAGIIALSVILIGGASAAFFLMPKPETVKPVSATVSGLPDAGLSGPIQAAASLPKISVPTPAEVRGIYLTGWIAGSSKRRTEIIAKMETLGLNAVVVDVKDYSGYVSYAMPNVPEVAAAGADKQLRIADPEEMLRDFHSKGIYVIARLTVFQDPIFSAANPDLSLKDKRTGKVWKDSKGLAWLDPAGDGTWKYVESIARDASARGFDEVNFDYIRFPSDGSLSNAEYPFYNAAEPKHKVIDRFFKHLRENLPNEKISADLFGLTASAEDDMGIGQMLADAFPYFDYVSPMVYPSHFAPNSYGYKNPADAPLEVIRKSMEDALAKRNMFLTGSATTTPPSGAESKKAALLRPWLQDFDLGARYDHAKLEAQIEGAKEAFASSGASNGWVFWDPKNLYTDL